jgi:NADH-quinone oxidoreductase subunit N
MGSFDVIEISELSQSAELPIWFPIGTTIGMFLKLQQYLSILGA